MKDRLKKAPLTGCANSVGEDLLDEKEEYEFSTMNVHHLELLYYVAKRDGITAAARKMPRGIRQSIASG
jgi:hypothetical protein